MKPDLFWIPGPWRGRLAITPRPRGGDWLEDEAKAWKQAGISTVISLLETSEEAQLGLLDERHAAEDHGIEFISFPIPDRGVPASRRDAVSLIGRIASQLETGRNIAVHCRQSVGRSGLIAAGVLMTSGRSADEAFRAVSSARGVLVPETAEQRRWAKQLPSRSPVARI